MEYFDVNVIGPTLNPSLTQRPKNPTVLCSRLKVCLFFVAFGVRGLGVRSLVAQGLCLDLGFTP